MSDLRRRVLRGLGLDSDDSSPQSSRDASPAPGQKDSAEYKVVPKRRLEKLIGSKKKSSKRWNAWIFVFGGLFGIFVAGFFASSNGGFDGLVEMAGLGEMRLDSLLDVLPAGLIKDVQNLHVSSARSFPRPCNG